MEASLITSGYYFTPELRAGARRLRKPTEAREFYRALASAGEKVRVGMEVSGHARWFEGLLAELQFELWIGDATEIQSQRVCKQKTDRQDAQHILKLMLKDDFCHHSARAVEYIGGLLAELFEQLHHNRYIRRSS